MNVSMPGQSGGDANIPPSFLGDPAQSSSGGPLGVTIDESIPLDGGKGVKHSGALVLLAVVAVAGGAIWGMRKIGTSGSESFAGGPEIDYPIDELGSTAIDPEHEIILRQLQDSGSIAHVPLENVDTNPFQWNIVDEPSTDPGGTPVDESELQRQRRLNRIETEFSQLRLNSVVGGSRPVARVSGELVRIGDRLGEYFVVKAIERRSVVLEADGTPYTLEMQQR